MKKWLVGLIMVLLIGLALVYWGAHHMVYELIGLKEPAPVATAPTASAAAPIQVEVSPIRQQRLAQQITAVGSLLAQDSVVLRAETDGRIASIHFKEGSPSQKDQLLVQLDTALLDAELQQAQANLRLADSRARRAQQLKKEGFISAQAQDESASERAVAAAQVAMTQAKINKSQIKAPFDGVLGLRHVAVGDYVSPGTEIVALASIDQLQVDFRIPEQYLSQVQVGTPVHIRLDAQPDTVYDGVVNAISPLVDQQGRAVVLRAHVPNPDGVMRPGQFARISVDLSAVDALMVPETALAPSGQSQYVYRLNSDDTVERVEVLVGQRQQGWVHVMGIEPDDLVLSSGLQKVHDGSVVRYQAPTDPH